MIFPKNMPRNTMFNKKLNILWVSLLILTIVPVNAYGIEESNPDNNNTQQMEYNLECFNTVQNTTSNKNTTVIPSRRLEKIFAPITIGLLSSSIGELTVNVWANAYNYLNVAWWTTRIFWVNFVLTGISLALTLISIDTNWGY